MVNSKQPSLTGDIPPEIAANSPQDASISAPSDLLEAPVQAMKQGKPVTSLFKTICGNVGDKLSGVNALLAKRRDEKASRLEQEREEQERAALTDAITCLPNQRAIMGVLDQTILDSLQSAEPCAVIFLNLEHFSHVNTTWGPGAGDAILYEMGQRLRNNIREDDFVGRYDVAEFALVLKNSNEEGATIAIERLQAVVISEPFLWEVEEELPPMKIAMSGSFGIAISGVHGTISAELITSCKRSIDNTV